MKIAHFNTFLQGGAATAAKRIFDGLQQFRRTIVSNEFFFAGADDSVLCEAAESDAGFRRLPLFHNKPNRFRSPLKYFQYKQRRRRIWQEYDSQVASQSATAETFAMAELPESTSFDWSKIDAEIAHLHWVSFMADYPSFFASIPRSVPIVWTLHDMNPFTGGCHYSGYCLNYRFGCGDCHQLRQPHRDDVSRSTLEAKKLALSNRQIHVVTPSDWLGRLAQTSPVWPDSTEFHRVHYGLDLQQFFPVDRSTARKTLGLDASAILIGFGAAELQAPRKGMQHLLNALRKLKLTMNRDLETIPPIECVLFGAGALTPSLDLPKLNAMGFLNSIEQQRLVYSAVDFVVVPSREDNQPQIGLEAMACGTPVVAFDCGGIAEYVRDGETGLLAPLGDELALAKQILTLAQAPQLRERLSTQARRLIESEFDVRKQSEQYLELYQSLVSHDAKSRPRQVA